ncbi:hypothetical protein [Streptomyces zaomyceticus]|uniref:hypothetical protein n=1 Tax=Streptomyces zaomyceticus TaxID=68286 RepID=UPI00343A31D5
MVAAAWNLAELVELRASGGLDAVGERLAEPAPSDGDGDSAPTAGDDGPATAAGGDSGRRITLSTGYEMNPWADLKPAGEGIPSGRKPWHSSPGSAG